MSIEDNGQSKENEKSKNIKQTTTRLPTKIPTSSSSRTTTTSSSSSNQFKIITTLPQTRSAIKNKSSTQSLRSINEINRQSKPTSSIRSPIVTRSTKPKSTENTTNNTQTKQVPRKNLEGSSPQSTPRLNKSLRSAASSHSLKSIQRSTPPPQLPPPRTTQSACSNHSLRKKLTASTDQPLPKRPSKPQGSLRESSRSNHSNNLKDEDEDDQRINQTPSKSSSALREMLAKARKNHKEQKAQINHKNDDENDENLESDHPILQARSTPNSKLIEEEWGLQPVESLIGKAQLNGKLNLSSRMLEGIPEVVYNSLLPQSSVFHPSNRNPNPNNNGTKSLSSSSNSNDHGHTVTSVPWYESVELCHINLALNELVSVDEEFGGFQALISCDLHHNKLSSLPSSFGLLINLTILNLSSNRLRQFPLPILSLVNLKELNLSKNELEGLWSSDWKLKLKKLMVNVIQPTRTTTSGAVSSLSNELGAGLEGGGDQSFNSSMTAYSNTMTGADSSFGIPTEDPFDLFPSSPKKATSNNRSQNGPNPNDDNHPLPSLERLDLSQNKFKSLKIFGGIGSVALPLRLKELDLSENPAKDKIEIWNGGLSDLRELEILKLKGCEIGNEVFGEDEKDQLVEEDQDEGENRERVGLFRNLMELDLSFNAIDSLEFIENFFEEICPFKKIRYESLPEPIQKFVDPSSLSRSSNLRGLGVDDRSFIKINIGNNFLRDEVSRRRKLEREMGENNSQDLKVEEQRKLKEPSQTKQSQAEKEEEPNKSSGPKSSTPKESSKIEDLKKEEVDGLIKPLESLSILSEPKKVTRKDSNLLTKTSSSPTSPIRTELKKLILKNYKHQSYTLDLKSTKLLSVPEIRNEDRGEGDGGGGYEGLRDLLSEERTKEEGEEIVIRSINLSINRLVKIPFELLYISSNSLTYLNLSRNQIRLSKKNGSGDEGLCLERLTKNLKLPELIELDLSTNFIEESEGVFELIYNLTTTKRVGNHDEEGCEEGGDDGFLGGDNLRIVDLSYNSLRNDRGLKRLIYKKGLREVRLNGNRIESIEDLEGLGNVIYRDQKRLEEEKESNGDESLRKRSELMVEKFKDEYGRFFGFYGVEVVELRDNCIRSLPNSLGNLRRLKSLEVSGNLFRVPLRKVYEVESGGSCEKLLKWLKERFLLES